MANRKKTSPKKSTPKKTPVKRRGETREPGELANTPPPREEGNMAAGRQTPLSPRNIPLPNLQERLAIVTDNLQRLKDQEAFDANNSAAAEMHLNENQELGEGSGNNPRGPRDRTGRHRSRSISASSSSSSSSSSSDSSSTSDSEDSADARKRKRRQDPRRGLRDLKASAVDPSL